METIALGKEVLIDTSVWIDYLTARSPTLSMQVDAILERGLARISFLVLGELLHGAHSERERSEIRKMKEMFPRVIEWPEWWEDAGNLARKVATHGVHVGLGDCYLSVVALKNNLQVLSLDRHFKAIAKAIPIHLISP